MTVYSVGLWKIFDWLAVDQVEHSLTRLDVVCVGQLVAIGGLVAFGLGLIQADCLIT